MIRVLIAEDETMTRVGIRYCLDREGTQYELVGEAVNGTQALEMCETLQPDILLTDIKMPEIDGIELIRRIRERKLAPKIIILTCYDDFDYLHQAMHLGIEDYVLKMGLSPEALFDVLEKVRKKYWSDMEPYAPGNESRFDALEAIMLGYINESAEIQRLIDIHHLDLRFQRYCMLLIYSQTAGIDNPQPLSRSLIQGIRAALADCIKVTTAGEVIYCNVNRFAAFVDLSGVKNDGFLNDLICRMSLTCMQNMNVMLRVGVSSEHSQPEELESAYDEAESALLRMYFEPDETIYYYQQRDRNEGAQSLDELPAEIENMRMAVCHENCGALREALTRFNRKIHALLIPGNEILLWYIRAYFAVAYAFEEKNGIDMHIYDETNRMARSLLLTRAPDEIIGKVNRLIEDICIRMSSNSSADMNPLIRDVIAYIERNYAENLTLETISRHFAINPTYFCKLFKKSVGATFINYLTDIRIKKAMQLIRETNMPNYLIAEKTGYQTPEYFSKIFKKKTGLSPKEYKQRS